MRQRVYIAVFGLMLAPCLGNAQDFNTGLAAAKAGDYATALREWAPLAAQGNAYAQYNLGLMYDNSYGVPQDHTEAVKWYRRAAEQGYAAAQYNLGISYTNGQGVPQNYAEAAKWYRHAAEQGDADAQANLGASYAKGEGVPQDYIAAHMWANIAASKGNEIAISNRKGLLGMMQPADVSEAQRRARVCLASDYSDCD